MKKNRAFGIQGCEYPDESTTLIFPDLEDVITSLREEIENLPEGEERDFTISVKLMTMKEIEALPEAD